MDETYFDEGPAGNFETATLEITKELDTNELNSQNAASTGIDTAKRNRENEMYNPNQIPSSRDVSNIPFKHIDIHSFFSDRNEVVDRALKDCQESLINEEERDIIGSWLLTEISLWDIEKERLIILTRRAIYSIKYDFISLKILEYNRIPLMQIDTLVCGELVYPSSSLAPRLSGLAEGVSSIIHCAGRQEWSSLVSCTGLAQFEPRKKHMSGIRIMWNKGTPLSLIKKWNPFAKDIPWLTYASHPLFWYKGSEGDKAKFSVEGLQSSIKDLLSSDCIVRNGLIVIENYFGIGALVHNRNGLGFFKIRGKVSF
ncbi:tumor protein p63-regulated gene 1-like protein isoform X1 [Frieseomelitta varia]|uniref:tumor protein p63-regulated gene 1-like protein isoform X1 n=1 Tax=Frieseomelitta varia TaxID=561572 RepID=UPI001CB6AE0C|nr:tumor protein p63-regulated gene 1-like protein isoform X1 [Frieseomelitta varia]XP_043509411.1 tumor protein p63-regulated gene 1-like protein isoform X1 [Frieseomelitta varia]